MRLKLFVLLCISLCFMCSSTWASARQSEAERYRTISSSTTPNIFNLEDYGRVGDGVADDGPALQLALNAAASAGGGTIYVPVGRYAIITPVVKDFSNIPGAQVIGHIVGAPAESAPALSP